MNTLLASTLISLLLVISSPAQAQSWKVTSDVLAIGLPALAAALTLKQDDGDGMKQLSLTVGSTVLSSLVLSSKIHSVRPDGSGQDSFPSDHVAVAFAAARFIQKRNGDDINPYLLYGAASLTGLARVKANKHYWKDVVGGAALGYTMAEYFTENRNGQRLSVLPSSGGITVAWQQDW